MPSLSLALNASTARKPIGGDSVIWRILISGAGTATSNGEYAWDGVSVGYENKPTYTKGPNSISYNFEMVAYWSLYDNAIEDSAYRSNDLITWTVDFGTPPAPTSTLYYTP